MNGEEPLLVWVKQTAAECNLTIQNSFQQATCQFRKIMKSDYSSTIFFGFGSCLVFSWQDARQSRFQAWDKESWLKFHARWLLSLIPRPRPTHCECHSKLFSKPVVLGLLMDAKPAQFITQASVSLELDFSPRTAFCPVSERGSGRILMCCLVTRKMMEEGSQEGCSSLKIIWGNSDTTLTIVFPPTCSARNMEQKQQQCQKLILQLHYFCALKVGPAWLGFFISTFGVHDPWHNCFLIFLSKNIIKFDSIRECWYWFGNLARLYNSWLLPSAF